MVSINAVGLGGLSPANAAGTTYDGATGLLTAAKQVTPGHHVLYLSVFDQADAALDSAAFVDDLQVGQVADPATDCVSGAQVKPAPVDPAPTNAAGGPYTGDEGAAVTVTGAAASAAGDPLQNTWSVVPGADVDPGAACTFADPHALATTVRCTDDGTWRLALSADNGSIRRVGRAPIW